MLRTAFVIYVRVLLCLQGGYLVFLGVLFWPGAAHGYPGAASRRPDTTPLVLLLAFLGLAEIATAGLLRRGRRWAAIAAILIEALWAALAAALGYKTLRDWPLDLQFLWQVTAAAALFLIAVVGLLLRPVRAYAGLVRR
jgi:hypothetical protein